MIRAIFLALILTISPAYAVDCETVRAYVAQHGRAKALAHAIRHGATFQQIREARRCLNDSRR